MDAGMSRLEVFLFSVLPAVGACLSMYDIVFTFEESFSRANYSLSSVDVQMFPILCLGINYATLEDIYLGLLKVENDCLGFVGLIWFLQQGA
ncbi:hypothetical protein MKW98_018259 [Papaver atlanticum]|uniref:Uncharacterized protein n=1 Tax=Papaver atlanticum TaxID=357466 RepID=A0AAD4S507_9MAGN|nr:hypothetical protein MKW98_018259 [Papaver atlanticum]